MNIEQIAQRLTQGDVVAYPTEAVFGLGCDPRNQSAVEKLLKLKQRPVEKGLILVAHDIELLLPFIDQSKLSDVHWQRLTAQYAQPTTWLVPAHQDTPRYLTGQFDSIAVRLCQHDAVKLLCHRTGFALTSTSANLTGQPPCRTATEVRSQFGENFPVLAMPVGQATNPSTIRDLLSQQLIRQG